MKYIFYLIILSFIGCNDRNEFSVPGNKFEIPVFFSRKIPKDSRIWVQKYEAYLQYGNQKASKHSYQMKDSVMEIYFTGNGQGNRVPLWPRLRYHNKLMIKINSDSTGKAYYITWDNFFNEEDYNKPRGLDINEETGYLETNLDSTTIKKLYPDFHGIYVKKILKSINILDDTGIFTFWNLDFFRSIRLNEK